MQNGLQQRKMASFLRDLEIEADLLDKNRDKQGVWWIGAPVNDWEGSFRQLR